MISHGPSGPWWGRDRDRIIFERGANDTARSLVNEQNRTGRIYKCQLDVLGYETRIVNIMFRRKHPNLAVVSVDGPTSSKHRFPDGSLCMWHPWDPRCNRWIVADGLRELLLLVAIHLFKEAWWREFGEWLGPEVEHASSKDVMATEREFA